MHLATLLLVLKLASELDKLITWACICQGNLRDFDVSLLGNSPL